MMKEEKVSVSSKFWLCSADCLCGTLSGLITGGGMTYFYTKYLGLDEGLASIVWMIFAVWNALNDPLFGYISDRTKSKLDFLPEKPGRARSRDLYLKLVLVASGRQPDGSLCADVSITFLF